FATLDVEFPDPYNPACVEEFLNGVVNRRLTPPRWRGPKRVTRRFGCDIAGFREIQRDQAISDEQPSMCASYRTRIQA
ncbi:MAG: hypothetical protein ACLFTN_09405, partial [Phycisphaerae bacterium]